MKYFTFLLTLCGCATTQSLHQSGTYTVATVNRYLVTFKGIAGTYQMPVDTLHIGDTIRMNVVRVKGK